MKVYNEQHEKEFPDDLKTVLEELRRLRACDASHAIVKSDDGTFSPYKYVRLKATLLNRYMDLCSLKACVVAVSGGIDSAVTLGIVKYASERTGSPIEKIVPLLLPAIDSVGATNQDDATKRGLKVCKSLGLDPVVVDVSSAVKCVESDLSTGLNLAPDNWAIGQLVPYTRTPYIYFTTSVLNANGMPAIVCGTTNFSEGGYLGYVGKASDGLVDVQLISDIYKSEVYKVAEFLKLPQCVIDVTPTGDMYDNRIDEEVFGVSYDFVELYQEILRLPTEKANLLLSKLSIESAMLYNEWKENLENLHKYNAHKYLTKSPAVHLDLWESSVPGGWDNYFQNTADFMGNR